MSNNYAWSVDLDETNGSVDGDINWAEQQAPSTVNDSSRNQMATHARWYEAALGGLTTTGGALSYALTTQLVNPTLQLKAGMQFGFKAHVTSNANATLNINATGAKKLYNQDLTQVGAGGIVENLFYIVWYDPALDSANGGWVLLNVQDNRYARLAAENTFTAKNSFTKDSGEAVEFNRNTLNGKIALLKFDGAEVGSFGNQLNTLPDHIAVMDLANAGNTWVAPGGGQTQGQARLRAGQSNRSLEIVTTSSTVNYDAVTTNSAGAQSHTFLQTVFCAPWYNSTTGGGPNAVISSGGNIQRSTSSEKYKDQIEPADYDMSLAIVMDSKPIWYRSKCEADPKDWSWWGLSAEKTAEIDPRLVFWDEDEPESVYYDRYVPHLLNVIQRQQKAIEELQQQMKQIRDND